MLHISYDEVHYDLCSAKHKNNRILVHDNTVWHTLHLFTSVETMVNINTSIDMYVIMLSRFTVGSIWVALQSLFLFILQKLNVCLIQELSSYLPFILLRNILKNYVYLFQASFTLVNFLRPEKRG
jgi:hypothetical protein